MKLIYRVCMNISEREQNTEKMLEVTISQISMWQHNFIAHTGCKR